MRMKILFIVLVLSIILMSSYAMAIKPESPLGLLNEKNEKAPGHWRKITEFEGQKHFVNEIHSRILLRLEKPELNPPGLIRLVNEFTSEIEEEEIEELLQPIAIITWTNPVYSGKPISFYKDASYDPDGGDITLIEWDVNGDGSFEDVFNNINPILLVYDYSGTYSIGLRVTDDEGQINTVFETITVIDEIT
jgi:hypothetical protein